MSKLEGIPFETVLPFSCFDEEGNQYLVTVALNGTYYPGIESKNPNTVDSDWDAYGLQSYFDYKILSVDSTEGKEIKEAWIEDVEFQVDLYNEVNDFTYKEFEKDFDVFIYE